MYYLIEESKLPAELQGKVRTRVPDGRVVIDNATLKTCARLDGLTAVATKAELVKIMEEGKE